MKKLTTFLIVLLIALTSYALASSFKPYSYPFIGRWQPAEDSRLIDQHGFQDIQNLRKDGKRLKGVSGHSKINTTALTTTYRYSANAFHFRKDNPAESHVLVLAVSTGVDAEGVIWNNKTAIPAQGDFAGTLEHTDASGAGLGRFSMAPQGNMLYCNGKESKIWGGNEQLPTAFIVALSTVEHTVTNSKDYTNRIRNSLTDNDEVVTVGGGANDPSCKLLLHLDGADGATADNDSSTGGAHGAAGFNGTAQLDTAQKKWGVSSLLLDGNSDYLTYGDHADWDIVGNNADSKTADLWVRHTDHAGQEVYLEHWEDGNNFWGIFHDHGFGLTFYAESLGVPLIAIGYGGEITDTNWHHIALCKVANKYGLYKDGIQVAYVQDSDTDTYAGSLYIGVDGTPISYFDGHLDEIRIYHENPFNAAPVAGLTDTITVPNSAYSGTTVGGHWLVGYTRPLSGVKYYLSSLNTIAGTLEVEEWNGSSWTSLSITDSTSGLDTSEWVTWPSTVDTSKPKYLEGQLLYWYQFHLRNGNATAYMVTVDAPLQDITNIWDGAEETIASCKTYIGGATKEYSDEAMDFDWNSIILSGMTTAEYWYVGFPGPQQGFHIYIEPTDTHENVNAAELTIDRWTGDAWETVSNLSNLTAASTTFNQSGVITFSAGERGEEFERSLEGSAPFFYYRLGLSKGPLDADTEIDQVTGISVTYPLKGYEFPSLYAGRSFLFNETVGQQNKGIYSAYNAPDIWNGEDSGSRYFGDEQGLTAAVPIYNVFQYSGVYQLIVCKQHETWRLWGDWTDEPQYWELQKISGNIGCVAPLSMAACDVGEAGQESGIKRQLAIWQTDTGVVKCDGATIQSISDDIKCYWDRNDTRLIPVARLDDSVGWYDPTLRSYKLLITSGTGETAHNVELEYSLDYNEWTKIYREVTTTSEGPNPLQVGFMVKDTVGKAYSYGVTDLGYMYRLENGLTWDGTAIEEYIWTKDLMLDDEWPLMRHTHIEYFRLLYEQKSTSETINIAHYCDGVITAAGGTWDLPDAIDLSTNEYQTDQCLLGPCLYHSFKISGDFDVVYDGMELIGLGLYYEAYPQIRE